MRSCEDRSSTRRKRNTSLEVYAALQAHLFSTSTRQWRHGSDCVKQLLVSHLGMVWPCWWQTPRTLMLLFVFIITSLQTPALESPQYTLKLFHVPIRPCAALCATRIGARCRGMIPACCLVSRTSRRSMCEAEGAKIKSFWSHVPLDSCWTSLLRDLLCIDFLSLFH